MERVYIMSHAEASQIILDYLAAKLKVPSGLNGQVAFEPNWFTGGKWMISVDVFQPPILDAEYP